MAVSLSRVATDYNTITTGSTYTFSGASLGSEASDRIIIVVTINAPQSNDRVTAVTIGGNAATNLITSTTFHPRMWWLLVPTGATADIGLTFTSSAEDEMFAIWVYRVVGADTTTPKSAQAIAAETTSGSADVSAVITVPTGGALLAAAWNDAQFSPTSSLSSSWTNATEDADNQVDGSGTAMGYNALFTSAYSTTAGASQTITCTRSGTQDLDLAYLTLLALAAAPAATTNYFIRQPAFTGGFNRMTGGFDG